MEKRVIYGVAAVLLPDVARFPPFTVSFLSLRNVGSTHSEAQLLQAEERHGRANNRTGHSQRAGGYHRHLASQCVSTWEEGGANIDTLAQMSRHWGGKK